MSDSMIKRIERIICDGRNDDMSDELLTAAVFKALREPTEMMTEAGRECIHEGDVYAEGVWRAMIDAALQEKP